MRILFITERPYLPQQIGGREMVIHETVQELLRMGHKPFIMSGLEPGNWFFVKNRLLCKLTNNEYPMDCDLGYPVYRGWSWESGLADIIGKIKPDVAVVESTALKFLDTLRLLGVPAALRLHDTALHALGGDPRQYSDCQFIAVSSYLADRFQEKFSFRPTVIPPLVRRERCMANPTRKKIVFVNPRPVKGGDIAISVARNCPDIPFTFFQAWTLDSQVIELMKQAKSLRNVEWRSPVMDAKEIYKDAHTMLIPSRADETWGRIATEAHFNGIPVIASRRGGLVESVGPGGILLEPTASAEQWTEATRNIWNDPKYYAELSQSALQFSCRHDISERAIMGQFMMVLEQVTAENSRVSGRHYVPHPS